MPRLAWASRVLLVITAFWSPALTPDVLYGALWQLGRYPVSIYRPAVRALLTYVVPVAFVATYPARALTHRANPVLVAQGAVAAGLAVAAWAWPGAPGCAATPAPPANTGCPWPGSLPCG